MATGSGRFFAWVVGGALPAAIAADWLVSAWDQNAAMAEPFPAVCAIEQVTARWVLELLGPSRGLLGRLCHRRSDGQHRVPGCSAQLRARRARLGRRGRRPRGCSAGDHRRRARSVTTRSTGLCDCSGWAPAPSAR